jgi:hypothetical protein
MINGSTEQMPLQQVLQRLAPNRLRSRPRILRSWQAVLHEPRAQSRLLSVFYSGSPDRPIFVVGSPRSGKSTLANLLARHPDVADWSEIPEVWDPDHKNPACSHRWDASRVTAAESRRLRGRFYWYARLAGKKRFLNCHARTTVRIPYVLAIFPDCKLIHVQRDGRAVVKEMVNKIRNDRARQAVPMGGYCRPPGFEEMLGDDLVEQTCRQWLGILDTFRRDADVLPATRICHVRSEDLFEHPRSTLSDVLAYCELSDSDVLQGLPAKLTSAVPWESGLTPEEIATIRRLLEPALATQHR